MGAINGLTIGMYGADLKNVSSIQTTYISGETQNGTQYVFEMKTKSVVVGVNYDRDECTKTRHKHL